MKKDKREEKEMKVYEMYSSGRRVGIIECTDSMEDVLRTISEERNGEIKYMTKNTGVIYCHDTKYEYCIKVVKMSNPELKLFRKYNKI